MTTEPENPNLTNCALGQLLQLKFAVGDKGEVSGYGSIFGNIDAAGERVMPGAFSMSIASHRMSGTAPVMLWQHQSAQPIGRWTLFEEDSFGLRMEGMFNLNTNGGRDAFEHVKAGDVSGLSIGFEPVRKKRRDDLVIELLEVKLWEVSVVSFPANPKARVTNVKCHSRADVERLLREGGLPRKAAEKIAAGGWPLLAGQTHNPDYDRLAMSLKSSTAEMLKLKERFK